MSCEITYIVKNMMLTRHEDGLAWLPVPGTHRLVGWVFTYSDGSFNTRVWQIDSRQNTVVYYHSWTSPFADTGIVTHVEWREKDIIYRADLRNYNMLTSRSIPDFAELPPQDLVVMDMGNFLGISP